MSKMFGFLKDGLDANEATSLIGILLIAITIVGFVILFKTGDVPTNYRDIWLGFGFLCVGDTGVNAFKKIKEKISNNL